jgi:hypothetical protein
MGYLAGGATTIRVGAGGIMLPNHPPIVVAERFGTLEVLLEGLIAETGADELMLVSAIFDPAARVRSYALPAEAMASSGRAVA